MKRNRDSSFSTSIYRKKTFTGLYTKWDSFTPRKYKINLVRTLAYSCIRICSSPRLFQSALDDLKRILLLNGYPMGTVKYHMNDVIEKHQNKPKVPVQIACERRRISGGRFSPPKGRETTAGNTSVFAGYCTNS